MLEFNLDHYGKQEKVQVTVNLIGQLLYRKTSSRKYIAIAGLAFLRRRAIHRLARLPTHQSKSKTGRGILERRPFFVRLVCWHLDLGQFYVD